MDLREVLELHPTCALQNAKHVDYNGAPQDHASRRPSPMTTSPLLRLKRTLARLTRHPGSATVKRLALKQTATRRTLSGALPAVMAMALAGAALAVTTPAQAASSRAQTAHTTDADGLATAKSKRHRVVKPKVDKGSSTESTAERDRRLMRECRGMPNAGACLGYTR
jgi:hypothetical protein